MRTVCGIIKGSPAAAAMSNLRALFVSAFIAAPLLAQTGQYFVARSASGGTPSIQTVETFLINGEDSVRTLPEPAISLDQRTYSRLPKVRLSTIGVLRRDGKNVYQIAADGKRIPVVPDNARIQASASPEDLWSQATIAAGATRRERDATAIPFQEWVAAGSAGVVSFVLARHNFASLEEQLSFLKIAEGDQIRSFLAAQMTAAIADFENAGSYERLLEGLRYAAVAPQDPNLTKIAQELQSRRTLVESSLKTLQSLFDNRRWDDFLDKYSALEKYENSFPRMRRNRRRALLETAHLHVRSGRPQTALLRDPANKPLQDVAEQKRLEIALAAAKSRPPGLAPDSAEGVRFARHTNLAARYLTDKNFAEAERELNTAAGIDRDSPRLLLLRARLHKDRNNLVAALTTLNEYDERASDPADRRAGEELRTEVMYSLNKQRTEAREQLARLRSERRYSDGLALATKALELDPRDPEFLWHAGIFSAIDRSKAADRYLSDYLDVTNTLAADPARRRLAYRVKSLASAPVNTTVCKPAAGVFYCPDTLMFHPRIASVRARDVIQTFEWTSDGKLGAIRRPGGLSFVFGYAPDATVARVSMEKPDAQPLHVNLLSPLRVNTEVIALLEDRAPATGFAGNPYFNPFVWSGLHTFQYSYDKNGRVEQATEIGAARHARFQWDGNRLQSIAVFADKDTERPVYRRSLSWTGDRLVSETVEYGGRQYRINYKYVGDRLTEAEFDDNGAHDGQSRTIRFSASAVGHVFGGAALWAAAAFQAAFQEMNKWNA